MKKNTRKGFTITELVIVIAVIAILAAVLIPTFSSIINKANDSKTLQEARNIMVNYIAANDGSVPASYWIKVGEDAKPVYYKVVDGQLQEETKTENAPEAGATEITIVSKDGADENDDFPEVTVMPTAAG